MSKKYQTDRSLLMACVLTAFIITSALFVGLINRLSLRYKNSQRTEQSITVATPTPDAHIIVDDTNRTILLTAYVDKSTFKLSNITADYLAESSQVANIKQEDSLFTLFSLSSSTWLNDTQFFSATDQLFFDRETPTTSRKLNYWIISAQIPFSPDTFHWQLQYNPTGEKIWQTNVHLFLLQQTLSKVPDSHFAHGNSKQMIEEKIRQLEQPYEEMNTEQIQDQLEKLKEIVTTETKHNTLKMTPLQVDQADFVFLIDDLLQGTKYL